MPKPVAKKPKTSLGKKLSAKGVKTLKREPLWKGPEVDGITQSLLSRFLVCRERFRLLVIEGWKPSPKFEPRLEYGNMWHLCEEVFAASGNPIVSNPIADPPWKAALKKYVEKLIEENRFQQTEILHWYNVCLVQFPYYIQYWKKHRDQAKRIPLLQEQTFAVPYVLPSGRTVTLRGKMDSVDLVKDGKRGAIWLQENKTKGDINEMKMQRQLSFDLQTMIYIIALGLYKEEYMADAPPDPGYAKEWDYPIVGVRYNVIRRPLSGGKGTIKKHEASKGSKCGLKSCREEPDPDCPKCNGTGRVGGKPAETDEQFYARLGEYIKAEPETYFMRWNVEISQTDIERFKRETLNPILEQLWDWWGWITKSSDPFSPNDGCENSLEQSVKSSIHWRTPYGLYNPMLEGNVSDLDEYLATGDTVGLSRATSLFGELETP